MNCVAINNEILTCDICTPVRLKRLICTLGDLRRITSSASPGRRGHEPQFVIRHKPPKVLLIEDERADYGRAAGLEPRRQRARAAMVHHRPAFWKEPRVRRGR